MQTIIKTAHASNFTIIANDLINSTIPPTPKSILLYLLSKPVTWQLKSHDLRKQLGLTAYAVKKALRWLCSAGFAAYMRLKTGHTIWRIFDKPQIHQQTKSAYSPAIPPQVEIPQVAFQPVLINTETEERKKPLQTPPEIHESIEHVVVDSDLIYPVQLNPTQKKGATHVIKKCNPELQQPVLFALAYAMAQNKVKSPVAYLNGLITRANNGTFEPVGATTASKQCKPTIWQGHVKTPPIDNASFFQDLVNKFGNKAAAAIPAGIKTQ
jgi:hypothetical protein